MSPRMILLAVALLAAVPAHAELTLTASWYGRRFHGRLAASGCRYDMHALTAASRALPLGSIIEVSRSGRTVRLLINDRGPYVRNRGLDVSYAAAQRLDMLQVGVALVQVRLVGFTPLRC
jgi:rare lipoprotein A